jgi:hypothetical protein
VHLAGLSSDAWDVALLQPADPMRELAKELADWEVDAQKKSILDLGVMADVGHHLTPLH